MITRLRMSGKRERILEQAKAEVNAMLAINEVLLNEMQDHP